MPALKKTGRRNQTVPDNEPSMLPTSSINNHLQALKGNPLDDKIETAVRAVQKDYANDANIAADLATVLASSGRTLSVNAGVSADIASTGGPTSLSTLIGPLFLHVAGAKVPKIGVPGRPAGGIDCLAQIPGFRPVLSVLDAQAILDRDGFVHFLAEGESAPLDGRMFKIRQRIGAQTVPGLVVASLLAKKLAAGVKFAGLDVRVAPHGNFGVDWSSAGKNADLYRRAAEILQLKGVPILTDGRYPYQPYIGRRESLVALHEIFENRQDSWLGGHLGLCRIVAQACLPSKMRSRIAKTRGSDLRESFELNLKSQGGSVSDFLKLVEMTKAAHSAEVVAETDGFCCVRLMDLRRCLVDWQSSLGAGQMHAFPDPVGVILLRRPGEWVLKGTPLATARMPAEHCDSVLCHLKDCVGTRLNGLAGPGFEGIYG